MPRKEYAKPFSVRPRTVEEAVLLRTVASFANNGNLSGFILDAAVEKAKGIIQAAGAETVMAAFKTQQAAEQARLASEADALRASLAEIDSSTEA